MRSHGDFLKKEKKKKKSSGVFKRGRVNTSKDTQDEIQVMRGEDYSTSSSAR